MKTRIRIKSGAFEETIYTDKELSAIDAAVLVFHSKQPKGLGKLTRITMRGPNNDSVEIIETIAILKEVGALEGWL